MKRKHGRLLRGSGQVSPHTPGTGKHKPCTQGPGSRILLLRNQILQHTAGVLLVLSRTMFLLGTLSAGLVLCAVQVRPTAFERMVSDVDPLHGDPTANKDGIQCRDWTLLSPPQRRGSFAFSSLLFPHSKLTVSLQIHANTETDAKTTEHLTVCKSSMISKNQ